MRYLVILCLSIPTLLCTQSLELATLGQLREICKDSAACEAYFAGRQEAIVLSMHELGTTTMIDHFETLAEQAASIGEHDHAAQMMLDVAETHYMSSRFREAHLIYDSLLAAGPYRINIQGRAHYRKGDLLSRSGDISESIHFIDIANALAKESADTSLLINTHQSLGRLYGRKGDKIASAKQFFQSRNHFRANTHVRQRAAVLLELSHLFGAFGIDDKRDAYLSETMALVDATSRLYRNNLAPYYAEILVEKGQVTEARQLLEDIGESDDDAADADTWAYRQLALASTYLAEKKHEYALRLLDGLELDTTYRRWQVVETYALYIDIYMGMQDYIAAAHYLADMEAYIEGTESIYERQSYWRRLAQYYKATGQSTEALAISDQYRSVKDSLYQLGQAAIIFDLEAQYEKARSENTITNLSLEKEITDLKLARRTRLLFLGSVGLAILTILLGLTYYLFKKNKEKTKQLSQQNEVISRALDEKAVLLKEVHHRVKNNLQVVSSLLALQSRYVENDKALEAIKTGRSRVQSMSLLHQNLYRNEDLKKIYVKKYFEDLIDNLHSNYQLPDKDIVVEAHIDDLYLDIDTVVPIGLVCNELISNSLKHAFVDKQSGKITIVLKEVGSKIHLVITDNGQGLPFTSLPERSESLGLQLIKNFVDKLEADIHITNDEGSRIEITIPSQSPLVDL